MTFATPWLLLGLLLIPLLAAAYAATERRRRRAAAGFAAAPTRASVVPRGPGWRRHAPLALAGLAMAGLVVALARPSVTQAVPAEQASIVLAIDDSGSMQATDVAPSRLEAVREAGESFLASVPDRVRVGGIVFDHRTEVVSDPTTDRAALREALAEATDARGGTATGDALQAGLDMLDVQRGADGKRAPGAIVLLSDGQATSGRDPLAVADEAARRGVPVYTVALGTPGATTPDGKDAAPDPAALAAIAERSGGEAFTAQDADGLSAVYERLGSQVAMKDEPREITGAFAGGAMLLLLAGGGLSLRWFRRLI
jgi:Ca-activated chloride channel family protein